jgi:glycosyltransferase involved in cell wall biosynthesis
VLYRHRKFVTESLSSEDDLVSLGVQRDRVVRIPPGVDSSQFHPVARSPEPMIVWCGRMLPYKQPQHALLALRELRNGGMDVKMVMIGGGPELANVRQLARDLTLEDSIKFTGVVPDPTLTPLLGQAWVSLQCSRTEGWGLTSMEAAACGVPTVTYDVPGLRETVRDGKTGMLVSQRDGPAGLAGALREVILAGTGKFQPACLDWARGHSWEATVARWSDTLEQVAAR